MENESIQSNYTEENYGLCRSWNVDPESDSQINLDYWKSTLLTVIVMFIYSLIGIITVFAEDPLDLPQEPDLWNSFHIPEDP